MKFWGVGSVPWKISTNGPSVPSVQFCQACASKASAMQGLFGGAWRFVVFFFREDGRCFMTLAGLFRVVRGHLTLIAVFQEPSCHIWWGYNMWNPFQSHNIRRCLGCLGVKRKHPKGSSQIRYDWKARIYLKELVCSLIKWPFFEICLILQEGAPLVIR